MRTPAQQLAFAGREPPHGALQIGPERTAFRNVALGRLIVGDRCELDAVAALPVANEIGGDPKQVVAAMRIA